jgi:hypothetical protein
MVTMIQPVNMDMADKEALGAVAEPSPEKPFQEVLGKHLTAADQPSDEKEEEQKSSSDESGPINPALLAEMLFNQGEGPLEGQSGEIRVQDSLLAPALLAEGGEKQGASPGPAPGTEGNPDLRALELSQPLQGENNPLTESPLTNLNKVPAQSQGAEGSAAPQEPSRTDLPKGGERHNLQASSRNGFGEGIENFDPGKEPLDPNFSINSEKPWEQTSNLVQAEKIAQSSTEAKHLENSPKIHPESPENGNLINTLAGNSKSIGVEQEGAIQSRPSVMAKEPPSLIQHIADRMIWSVKNNEERIHLTLEPPQLGNLSIEIHKEKNQIQATLWADNALTKEILESSQSQLRKTLEVDGFQLVNYDVLVKKDMGSFQRQEGSSFFDGRGTQEPTPGSSEPELLPSTEIPPARLWATLGGRTIDRFV